GEFIVSITGEEIPDYEYPDDDAFTDALIGDEDDLLTDEMSDPDAVADDGQPTDHDTVVDVDQWQPDADQTPTDDQPVDKDASVNDTDDVQSDADELLTDQSGDDSEPNRPKDDGCGCSLVF
ncbi:MAG TPA: hypothetical protein PKH10_12750, partial [bacterium]|nr:hypothetical protein [bacterium]